VTGGPFRGLDPDAFTTAVKDAVMRGPEGEAALVAALPSLSEDDRVTVIAVLGDAQGSAGVPALRALLERPDASEDERCAALLSLAKREGSAASDVLAALVVVTYLVRHLSTDAPARKAWLVTTLRDRYDRLHAAERQFVERHWPGGPPGGPPPEEVGDPDPAPFRAWARDPLFGPVY
jgi:hypothetical protein